MAQNLCDALACVQPNGSDPFLGNGFSLQSINLCNPLIQVQLHHLDPAIRNGFSLQKPHFLHPLIQSQKKPALALRGVFVSWLWLPQLKSKSNSAIFCFSRFPRSPGSIAKNWQARNGGEEGSEGDRAKDANDERFDPFLRTIFLHKHSL